MKSIRGVTAVYIRSQKWLLILYPPNAKNLKYFSFTEKKRIENAPSISDKKE